MPLEVEWIKCTGNIWCNLLNLNLNNTYFNNLEGVYIIWHEGRNPAIVRVGQGIIKDRLEVHRNDPEILAYQQHTLYATWAEVPENYRDSVEAYLGERLNPNVGSNFPDVAPISVNLPW